MCSVVGYIGEHLCKSFIIQGLSRLEYRGYDSAGFACLSLSDNQILFSKAQGRLSELINQLASLSFDGHVGIGHTRWATHGAASSENAHPHFDCEKTVSVVHNGIIENHHKLKQSLVEQGHIFHSQTDTEIIAHLLEDALSQKKEIKQAVIDVLALIEGAFAFIAIFQDFPDLMIVARKRSPVCIGIGTREMFIASDSLAFTDKAHAVVYLPDLSFAILTKDAILLYSFDGKSLRFSPQIIDDKWREYEKKEHEHFMLKEIYEQKAAIYNTVEFLSTVSTTIWDHVNCDPEYIRSLDHLHIIACGTSWHAARIAQFFFESIALIPTRVHLASEFRYMPFFRESHALHLFISQSGETADTLEALRMVRALGVPTVAITNVASSTLVRDADGFLLTHHEREIAVASTKAFSTQLALLYWLAHRIGVEKGIISTAQLVQAQTDITTAAEVLENSIEEYKQTIVQDIAPMYAQFTKAIFLGRHSSYPFAMEAALKLKEVAYIFSQCYPAGELKHGPLALIDQTVPVFIFSHQDPLIYQKIVSNAQEVKARGGIIVVFAFKGQHELIELADTSFTFSPVKPLLDTIAMAGVMQFLVYAIAKNLGCAIDNPRNLAKSVTVE